MLFFTPRAPLSRRSSLLLGLAGALGACHEDSESAASETLPVEVRTTNLGYTLENVHRSGSLRLLEVHETRQGLDLNGDGDLFDRIACVADLDRGEVTNTGLGGGFPHSAHSPPAIVTRGTTLAFAVSEWETAGLDRNGDGDALDRVLGLYEPESRSVTNLGLAVRAAHSDDGILACEVAEIDQGVDLDGNGSLDDSCTVFVHDRRSAETWDIDTRGVSVLAVKGDFVALSVDEVRVGDRNGDGDAIDLVFELYDAGLREFHPVGLASTRIFNPLRPPVEHRGLWAVLVSEQDQGATDLDDDGDAEDHVTMVYDPRQRTTRSVGQRIAFSVEGIEPLVLQDFELGAPFQTQLVWLYHADRNRLENTGLHGTAQVFDGRLLVSVDEEAQGTDLDRSGTRDSIVPVFYDLSSGRTQNLGIDAETQVGEEGLLLLSREIASRRDWNGDGDRDDVVLFTWEPYRGLVNSRLSPRFALPLGEDVALLLNDEGDAGQDLNGDGDLTDTVLATYEAGSRLATNLGLAANYIDQGTGDRALFSVAEWAQGVDLTGDGNLDDQVVHLTEILLRAR
jgi:hypothetical protein